MEKSVENCFDENGPKPLRRVTLPSEEADRILQVLWGVRASRAYLMPSHDNITRDLRLKWSWP